MDVAVENWSKAVHESLIQDNSPKSLLRAMFGVLSTPAPYDDMENFRKNNFVQETLHTLQVMAENIPSEEFLRDMLELIKPGIQSSDPHMRKAALLAMRALASEPLDEKTNKLWKPCLPYFLKGISDPHPVVQNAAFFAFENFEGHLYKVGAVVYVAKVIPVLQACVINFIKTWQKQKQGDTAKLPPHISDFFESAGKLFAQDLSGKEKDPRSLAPFNLLFYTIYSTCPLNARLGALKAVKYAVNRLDLLGIGRVLPYVHYHIGKFVKQDLGPETLSLQINVIAVLQDLFSKISSYNYSDDAKTLVKDRVRPLTMKVLALIRKVFDEVSSREDVETICSFLNRLHDYFEADDTNLLEHMVTICFEILKEQDETKEESGTLENAMEIGDTDTSDSNYIFPSNSRGRKERACIILASLSKRDTMPSFGRYSEAALQQLMQMTSHSEGWVRGAALEAISVLCIEMYDKDTEPENQTMANFLITKCANVLRNDTDENALTGALGAIDNVFSLDNDVSVNRDSIGALVDTMKQFYKSQTKCQTTSESSPRAQEDFYNNVIPFESLIFDYFAEFIEYLGDEMQTEEFRKTFEELYPLLLSKMDALGSYMNVGFAIYALRNCLRNLSEDREMYVEKIFPVFIRHSTSESDWLRTSALCGLAEYIFHCKRVICPYYSEILAIVRNVLSTETPRADLDAVCVAIAGMIATDISLVPLGEMIPILFLHLPLDISLIGRIEAYLSLVECFHVLYKSGHPIIRDRIALVTGITLRAGTISSKYDKNDSVTKLLLIIKKNFPDVLKKEIKKLPKEKFEKLRMKVRKILRTA